MKTTPTPAEQTTRIVVAVPTKSAGVAILLTVLFGPLGMFYSTVSGALVMIAVTLVAAFFTLGIGLIFTWPVCIIWAAMAASSYNKGIVNQKMKKQNTRGCAVIFCLLGLAFVVYVLANSSGSQRSGDAPSSGGGQQISPQETILRKTLSYLSTLEDVEWVHFENNNVYIGFTRPPPDLEIVLGMAAVKGNRAINFGVHVWGVPASATPGSVDRIYGEKTARYGKVER